MVSLPISDKPTTVDKVLSTGATVSEVKTITPWLLGAGAFVAALFIISKMKD